MLLKRALIYLFIIFQPFLPSGWDLYIIYYFLSFNEPNLVNFKTFYSCFFLLYSIQQNCPKNMDYMSLESFFPLSIDFRVQSKIGTFFVLINGNRWSL